MTRRAELMHSGSLNGAAAPRCQLLGLANRAGVGRCLNVGWDGLGCALLCTGGGVNQLFGGLPPKLLLVYVVKRVACELFV